MSITAQPSILSAVEGCGEVILLTKSQAVSEVRLGMLRDTLFVPKLADRYRSEPSVCLFKQRDFVPLNAKGFCPFCGIHAILVARIGRPGSCLSLQLGILPDGGSVF